MADDDRRAAAMERARGRLEARRSQRRSQVEGHLGDGGASAGSGGGRSSRRSAAGSSLAGSLRLDVGGAGDRRAGGGTRLQRARARGSQRFDDEDAAEEERSHVGALPPARGPSYRKLRQSRGPGGWDSPRGGHDDEDDARSHAGTHYSHAPTAYTAAGTGLGSVLGRDREHRSVPVPGGGGDASRVDKGQRRSVRVGGRQAFRGVSFRDAQFVLPQEGDVGYEEYVRDERRREGRGGGGGRAFAMHGGADHGGDHAADRGRLERDHYVPSDLDSALESDGGPPAEAAPKRPKHSRLADGRTGAEKAAEERERRERALTRVAQSDTETGSEMSRSPTPSDRSEREESDDESEGGGGGGEDAAGDATAAGGPG